MLDAWTAESKDDHRFLAEYLPGFRHPGAPPGTGGSRRSFCLAWTGSLEGRDPAPGRESQEDISRDLPGIRVGGGVYGGV